MGVRQIDRFLEQWQMDVRDLHRRLILATTPGSGNDGTPSGCWPKDGRLRVRYRPWDGIGTPWTMGRRLWRGRACRLDFRAVRWPPALGQAQQAELKAAVQELPAMAGIELANWNWKVVHQFVPERLGISLSRSGCLNYLPIKPVLVAKALEDALGRVALLPGTPEIVLQDPVDDVGEGLQLGPLERRLTAIPRRG